MEFYTLADCSSCYVSEFKVNYIALCHLQLCTIIYILRFNYGQKLTVKCTYDTVTYRSQPLQLNRIKADFFLTLSHCCPKNPYKFVTWWKWWFTPLVYTTFIFTYLSLNSSSSIFKLCSTSVQIPMQSKFVCITVTGIIIRNFCVCKRCI